MKGNAVRHGIMVKKHEKKSKMPLGMAFREH